MDDREQQRIAEKLQRQMEAFGQARTPLELQIEEDRIVVAGSQIFSVPKRWSFHQFLIMYGKNRLGADWLQTYIVEKSKNHPLAAHILNAQAVSPASISLQALDSVPLLMNGDLYAFLSFAYDLFTLADNAKMQESLLARVRNGDQYQGVRYEIYVAASLLRAGFSIEFEDEADINNTHCEFTAKAKSTNKSFSVEAKSRHRPNGEAAAPTRAGMYRLLQAALSKSANHERIIFADVNLPPDKMPLAMEDWHKEVMSTLSELEDRQSSDRPWPTALIFFTNRIVSPWKSSASGGSTVLLTAINHPLVKTPDKRPFQMQYPEIGKLFHAAAHLCRPPGEFFAQSIKSP